MKRDLYIDFAKGLATLSIVFIHTAFWSGQLYLPAEVRTLSLLIDVPVFFALSGLTSGNNVEKTLYRLLKLQVTYMIFVTFLFFLDGIMKWGIFGIFGTEGMQSYYTVFGTKYAVPSVDSAFNWDILGNWFLHSYSNCDSFPVVMGSFWYLKVYYIVTVFGVLVLKFFSQHVKWIIGVCLALTIYFNIDNDVMKNFAPYYPSGQVGYVAYYLAVFLIATQLKGKKIKDVFVPVLCGLVAMSLVTVFWYFGNEVFYKFNKQKFPPKIPYIVWSLLSLVTIFVLYNRLKITKDNFINYIGKNAIFYYFAQGMSSSVVYFLIPPLKDNVNTWVLMVIVYVLNVILAILFAEVLKKVDDYGWKVLEFLRKKTAEN